MEMFQKVGLPSCIGIAGNLVELNFSISAPPLRLSVLGLMSNLPALLYATSIALLPSFSWGGTHCIAMFQELLRFC